MNKDFIIDIYKSGFSPLEDRIRVTNLQTGATITNKEVDVSDLRSMRAKADRLISKLKEAAASLEEEALKTKKEK